MHGLVPGLLVSRFSEGSVSELPCDDIQRLDDEYLESTVRLIVDAVRKGHKPLAFDELHKVFFHPAKGTLKMSDSSNGVRAPDGNTSFGREVPPSIR